MKHPEEEKFDTHTRDVRFIPVNFSAPQATLWLPLSATVNVRFTAGELHSVHRFSDYQLDGPRKGTGNAVGPVAMEDDAFEVLLKGVAALEAGKPEDALAPLREAAGRFPDRIEPGYYLGLAMYRTHDLAGAETHFRETVKLLPGLAVAHNDLGAVLLERGDRAAAVAEFQEAQRLEPGNPQIRANLEGALKAADHEIGKTAVAGDVTIKVDVRQVLVPVVVTDKEGHHVTGLTQADFKVFEDGAEQKITAFTSERADVSTPPIPGAAPSQPDTVTAAGSPKPLATRRTYVICLDVMHASFGNFARVREALQKLFQQEQAGDSQYLVLALGRTIGIVQNTTSDPAKVLETLDGADFRKIFQQSQQSASRSEISQY